jgi:hypothetical protein
MAKQYIGPLDISAILEAAYVITGWPNHQSWPEMVNYLAGQVGIDEAYIQENETYIREHLDWCSFHSVGNIHNADTESTPRHSPPPHLQQWPATPPDSGRILNRHGSLDDCRLAASPSHSNGQRFSQLKSSAETNKTEPSKSLPYRKPPLQLAPLSKGGGDPIKVSPLLSNALSFEMYLNVH